MPDARYIRQETFEPIGPMGQSRIMAASVVVIGCGALGSHTANCLARAGVGRLRIVDRDVVELDNLQRQLLFDEDDARLGRAKAIAAVERLRRVNSTIALDARPCEVTAANAAELVRGFDVVMDGTDNVETRVALNDACLANRIPCVFGGAVGATGLVFPVVPGRTPCYRCLMAELPDRGATPTAATAGILHPTVAVVAALQCTTCLRLIIGDFEPGDVALCVDVWDAELTRVRVPRRAQCPACGCRGSAKPV